MITIDDRNYQSTPVSVLPPVVTTETEFPFHELGWDNFECLCRDIVQAHGFKNVHRYGESGQAQEGIDFTGDSSAGVCTAFQVKRRKELTASELEKVVGGFAKGALVGCTGKFVVCSSKEARDRKLLDKLAELNSRYSFPIELWGAEQLTHLLSNKEYLVRRYFGESWANRYFGTPQESNQSLAPEVAEAFRIGPVEAFGLKPKVEEADRLAQTSSAEAAKAYGVVGDGLRKRFQGHANHFDLLRAKALKAAGNMDASHDALMELAIRNFVEQAEPHLFPGVASELRDLRDEVDEVRQARADAVCFFQQWYEHPDVLEELAQCFDALGTDDEYAPVIAMLLAEAAVTDREFGVVLDRVGCLQRASTQGDRQTHLRINLALADAGFEGLGKELTRQAELSKLPARENAYVLLRAARRSAWEGESAPAEKWYRLAMTLSTGADLDLDVEKALWSLVALGTREHAESVENYRELAETNQLALTIQGSRSYVTINPRTRERSLQYLANQQLPDAHLWTRFRLLESIRSGSLADELESRAFLAQIFDQSGELRAALEQSLLSGDNNRAKDISARLEVWPDYLADTVINPASWVRRSALTALEQIGDLAPVQTARELARVLIEQLCVGEMVQATIQALQAVVIEADKSDLEQLMPVLKQFAPREPNTYKLTDQGVSVVAARLYRFRPALRSEAASVLAEMALSDSNRLAQSMYECGNDLGELVAALERVAERENRDFAGPLSDLGHLNAATRKLWSNRLQFVEQYPLGKRSKYTIGSRFDTTVQFLEEQQSEVVNRYVHKLVAIGSNFHEPCKNRAVALRSAATGVELLSSGRKMALFGLVKPLTDPETRISAKDEDQVSTLHPLSRIRISFGNVADIRAAALHVLAHCAVGLKNRAHVVAMAQRWLGAELEVLQRTGATVLSLPHLSSSDVRFTDLADHPNSWVRQVAIDLPNMRQCPDPVVLDRLASDPDRWVRMRIAYSLTWLRDAAPDAYERIGSLLSCDQSGVVRALTTEGIASANQQED